MSAEYLFNAIGEIDDRIILAAAEAMEKCMSKSVRFQTRKMTRIILIAAIIMSFLLMAACGAWVYYKMQLMENTETISQDFLGIRVEYDDVGLIISFDGSETCRLVGIKANYLPPATCYVYRYPNGEWCSYIESDDNAGSASIPYNIYPLYASSDSKYMIAGKTEIVRSEQYGNYQVIEIQADVSGTDYDTSGNTANFVIMFDREYGYAVVISSTMYDFPVLEKILENMEVHIFQEEYSLTTNMDYGFINPGRG